MQQWAEEYGIPTDASYDAVRVLETKDGQMRFEERRAPGKSRMYVSMGGMGGTVIMREDLGKPFFTLPALGLYREMS